MLNWLKPSAPASEMVAEPERKRKYRIYRTRLMFASIFAYSSYYIVRSNFTVASPELHRYYHFTTAEIGLVLSTLAVSYGIAKLFMGILADQLNPRYFVGVGLIISALFNTFLGATHNKYIMMALMIGVGITQGIGAPCCQKMLAAWFDSRHLGLATSTWNISHNVGPGTTSWIVAGTVSVFGAANLHTIFLVPSMVSIVMACIVMLLGVEEPQVYGLPPVNTNKKKNVRHKNSWVAFKTNILHNPLVIFICVLNVFAYIIRYGIENWIPVYLSSALKFTPTQTNLGYSIFEYAAIPGTILLGWVSDRYLKGRRLPITIGTSIAVVLMVPIYMHARTPWSTYLVLAILGICIFSQQVLMGIVIMDVLPVESVASGIGLAGFFGYVFGQVSAAYGIGKVVALTNWNSSFYIVITAAIICVICFIYIEKKFGRV